MPYLGRPVTNAGQFEIIDDISSGFNGSETSFTLQVGGTDIQPDSANVTIVLDGVVQIPPTAYSITGSTLNFSEAPVNGTGFHGVLAGQSQFIESGFITNTHISDSANISGSKINTDFSAQTVQAKIFSGMISSSAQISTDISGSLGSNAAIIRTLDRTTLSGSVTTVSSSLASRVTVNEGRVNQGVNTTDSPTFAGATITGTLTAQEIHTEFTSASILFTSGSTKFGDSGDDIHNMTGSIRVSGSLANESFINGHNVGIGTENPITTLDIHSDELGMVLRTGDSGRIGMAIMNSGTGTATNFTDGLIIKLDSDETGYVGLASDNPSKVFHLGANNTNVMTLSGSGNVGIGTNAPTSTSQLHVEAAKAEIRIKGTNDSHSDEVAHLIIEGSSDRRAGITIEGDSNALQAFIGRPYDSPNKLVFETSGSERIRIDNTGKVGIGTNNPNALLQISGSGLNGAPTLAIDNTSTSAYIHSIEALGGAMTANQINIINLGKIGSTKNSGVIGYKWVSAGSDDNLLTLEHWGTGPLVVLDGAGKVGIGTTSPLAKLHVEHTTDDTDENGNIALTVGGGASGDVRHYWGVNNSSNYAYYGAVEHATQYVPLVLQPNGSNVGIGTATVSSKLHIDNAIDQIAFFVDSNYRENSRFHSTETNQGTRVWITNGSLPSNQGYGFLVGDGGTHRMTIGQCNSAGSFTHASINISGSQVGIGDTGPDARLTVNHGSGDTVAFNVKSSDISVPFTGQVGTGEADTYFQIKKYSNTEGGANLRGYSEGERGLSFSHFGTSFDSPANGRGTDKGMQFFVYDSSGTSIGPVNSGGTCYIFRAYRSAGMQSIFMVDEDGDLHADGSTSITGFDYAEMFEWEDGNPSNEDRVGHSVVFGSSGDKIRVASGSEEPIGVVSARPGVIGDNPLGWHGTWKTDEWDRKIPGLIPMVSWSYDFTRDNGEVIQKTYKIEIAQTGSFLSNIPSGSSERGVPYNGSIPSNANYYNKEVSQVSDEYDDTMDYTTRRSRKEWDTIGLMGKIKVRTGQATGSRWIKMKDVSDSIQLWLVK